ncbi:hypothetical protein AB1E18_006211 [Capra hircus]
MFLLETPTRLDVFLPTVMACDRYVAICCPLHYMVIMNPWLCGLLLLVSGSLHSNERALVMYAVVTPMLSPFIYSLSNKDLKRSLKMSFGKLSIKGLIFLGLKKSP